VVKKLGGLRVPKVDSSVRNTLACLGVVVLTACSQVPSQRPDAVAVATRASVERPDRDPHHSVTIGRQGTNFELKVRSHSGQEPDVTTLTPNPLLLPVLFKHDYVGYLELLPSFSGAAVFMKELRGAKQSPPDYLPVQSACKSEVETFQREGGRTGGELWSEDWTTDSRHAKCYAAMRRAYFQILNAGAMNRMYGAAFAAAGEAFDDVASQDADERLRRGAMFWGGMARVGLDDCIGAVERFRRMDLAVTDDLAAEAQLATAGCQLELKQAVEARSTLARLVETQPGSRAAASARRRMAALDGRSMPPPLGSLEIPGVEYPRYIVEPRVRYARVSAPASAILSVLISKAGAPESVAVVKGSGDDDLDAGAVQALKRSYFAPARDAYGRRIAVMIRAPFTFGGDSRISETLRAK
jgi:TonB family protein